MPSSAPASASIVVVKTVHSAWPGIVCSHRVINIIVTIAMTSVATPQFVPIIVSATASRLVVIDGTIAPAFQTIGTNIIASGRGIHDYSHLECSRL
jgi:hypothetical protein